MRRRRKNPAIDGTGLLLLLLIGGGLWLIVARKGDPLSVGIPAGWNS